MTTFNEWDLSIFSLNFGKVVAVGKFFIGIGDDG